MSRSISFWLQLTYILYHHIHPSNRLIIEKFQKSAARANVLRGLFLSAESMKNIFFNNFLNRLQHTDTWESNWPFATHSTLNSNIFHIINKIFYSAHTFDTVFQFHFSRLIPFDSHNSNVSNVSARNRKNEVQFPFIMWFFRSPFTHPHTTERSRKEENAIFKGCRSWGNLTW